MEDLSRHFLVAVPTEATSQFLLERAQAAPIQINPSPVFFLSPPNDRDSLQLEFNYETTFDFLVTGHGFVYNPSIERTEFVLFIQPVMTSLLSDLGVDVIGFKPYGSLAVDPMRTSKIRFWLKNFGDSLVGQSLQLTVAISDNEVLREHYNPTLEQDHPHAYSDGL